MQRFLRFDTIYCIVELSNFAFDANYGRLQMGGYRRLHLNKLAASNVILHGHEF